MLARRVAMVMCMGLACWAVVSCQSPPQNGNQDAEVSVALPPTWSEFAAQWNDRVGRLQQFYSRGVIELRWEDEQGSHFEQGDVDVWVDLPKRTALRISKAGEVLAWLGSDDSRYWFFDLLDEPTQLVVASHDEPVSIAMAGLQLDSATLLDVLGLRRLGDTGTVRADAETGKWIARTQGAGAQLHMELDAQTGLPTRIEALDGAGGMRLVSELGRYERVEMRGVSSLNWPKLATRIVLTAPQTSLDGRSGDARLYLSRPTTVVGSQPMDRVFDLNRLMDSLQPDDVRGPAGEQ